MEVFISWSGSKSKAVAKALEKWLPRVIQSVKPWISTEMDKGTRWSPEIARRLETTDFGIFCLTSENLNEPWLLFEAGAVSKTVDASRVCPVLLDLTVSDVQGPLAQFQCTVLEKGDLLRLIRTLNATAGEPLPDDQLQETFDAFWPQLEKQISQAQEASDPARIARTDRDLLSEAVAILRGLDRRMTELEVREREDVDFSALNERERYVIKWIYGIDEQEHSYDEVAEKLGLSSREVQKIHDGALVKLRFARRPGRLKELARERFLRDISSRGRRED
jgi:hypothetical protein